MLTGMLLARWLRNQDRKEREARRRDEHSIEVAHATVAVGEARVAVMEAEFQLAMARANLAGKQAALEVLTGENSQLETA